MTESLIFENMMTLFSETSSVHNHVNTLISKFLINFL